MFVCAGFSLSKQRLVQCRPAARQPAPFYVFRTCCLQDASRRARTVCESGAPRNSAVSGVDPVVFQPIVSDAQFEKEKTWLAGMIVQWLDEEWTPLPVHQDLAAATAVAYGRVRGSGMDDAGDVLLMLIPELQTFNYKETFVNAFEVANKTVELVMMRDGHDVCCTSERDRGRVQSSKPPAQ